MTLTLRRIEALLTNISVVRRTVVPLIGLLLSLPSSANASQTSLALVSARDHIEGAMTSSQSVYADETRIYLATAQGTQGTLFVLSRDRAANFPVIQTILYTSALHAVRGDSQNVYVAAGDGNLLVYSKYPALALVRTIPLATYSLSSLVVTDDKVFVGLSTVFQANDLHVYLSAMNDGEVVIELLKPTLTPVRTYGEPAEANSTVEFDRQTGARVAGISPAYMGLYVGQTAVFATNPGCCGAGVFVLDANTLALNQFIARSWTDTVVQRAGLLIAGNEAGNVDLFDLAANPSPLVATVDLRQLTGHTGSEDIEIRALWADGFDNLIFAGSSWGNDQSRGPLLPSFFVLESISAVSLSSTNLVFGTRALGTMSASQTVTLKNTGAAPLNISGLAVAAGFPLQSNTCGIGASVPSGGSCTFSISFSPTATGITTGSISIYDDAADSPQVLHVTGVGMLAADLFFSDDLETGATGWSAQAPWSVTAEAARSGRAAWSDSPGVNYGPNLNRLIQTPLIDLTHATTPQLTFWHRRQLSGDGYDAGNVWVTTDNGSTYAFLANYTGTDLSWSQVKIDLTAYAGVPSLRVAFQIVSDALITGDGWYIDDIVVANTTQNDTAPPTVTSVTPPDAAVRINASTMVTAAFNEPIDSATLTASTFVLRNPANAVVTATITYNAGSRVGTLAPSAPLAGSTRYTATVTGGSSGVKDLAGNALASSVLWSFTTADTTPPTVTSATPASGASGVSAGTAVMATFSEPINAATLSTSTFVLRNAANAVVTATVSYNSGTRVGTLAPSAPLAASTTYTATITGGSAGVKDTAGNALATDFVRSFTTAAAVTLGSTTIGSSIDSGDSNALNGSRVRTSAAGRIASMSAYVGNIDALAAKRFYQVAIYTDNAGRPGTLIAVSATGTLMANAWNTLGVSASLLPSTNYWLMFNTNGRTSLVNNMRFRYGNAGQGAYSRSTVSFGTWPATFSATIDSLVFSLFATFGQ